MTKKGIIILSLFFCVIINILIDMNINRYILVLEQCFDRSIDISNYYMPICFIFALISTLLYLSLYFLITKRELKNKGLKLKVENGVYGTSDLMSEQLLKTLFEYNSKKGILIGEKDNKRVTLDSKLYNRNVAVLGSSRFTVKV